MCDTYPNLTLSATYSPEDNKLRLYASARLPKELYERVRGAGFIWAPRQELFVAPTWTPGREDLLIELCGEIGGPCALWTQEYGCSLAFRNRPAQCRTLVPNPDEPGKCSGPYDKEAAALAWLPFQEQLHAAADIVLNDRKAAASL